MRSLGCGTKEGRAHPRAELCPAGSEGRSWSCRPQGSTETLSSSCGTAQTSPDTPAGRGEKIREGFVKNERNSWMFLNHCRHKRKRNC